MAPFGASFSVVAQCFVSRFRTWTLHQFAMDFGMGLGVIADFVYVNYPFAHPHCKTINLMTLKIDLHVLVFLKI